MRIRFKKWARPELEASRFYIDNPEDKKGKWKEQFKNPEQPLHLELGCGKGQFIATLASSNLNINYIAIDLVDAMLGLAKRNIETVYQEKNLQPDNVYLTRFDIERITLILDPKDGVERIYINFCNPWPRPRHKKRRLTHIRQLEQYKNFLVPNAQIHFKTDDDELFKESIQYFKNCGFQIVEENWDLPLRQENIQTEHEKMFREKGIKIKKLIAQKKEF